MLDELSQVLEFVSRQVHLDLVLAIARLTNDMTVEL